MPDDLVADIIAAAFHDHYERLAPQFGYETREASRTKWADVPEAEPSADARDRTESARRWLDLHARLMSPHAATFNEALYAIDFILGWAGGSMPVELTSERVTFWHRCGQPGDGARLARVVRWHDERLDTEIRLGIPQAGPCNGGVSAATALWAVVDGKDQLQRAWRFKPRPSMVLQAGGGSRRWLLWALSERVDYFALEAANRKIAYALRAVQKHGDPDRISFPAPGTCLREDRARPVPVRVARLTTDSFTAQSVVGRLKEPPPKDAWLAGQVAR